MIAVWRDYQYQLIYHVFQREARRQKKDFVLYGSMAHVDVSAIQDLRSH